MSKLELNIEHAVSFAGVHANNCRKLIETDGLLSALKYCTVQDVEPPQCSLTANSPNANNLRLKAIRMLSDDKWWARRLEKLEIQKFEQQSRLSKPQIISNETLQYQVSKKRKVSLKS